MLQKKPLNIFAMYSILDVLQGSKDAQVLKGKDLFKHTKRIPFSIFLVSTGVVRVLLTHFSSNILFLFPLKTSENVWFSDVFRDYRDETLGQNRLRLTLKRYALISTNTEKISKIEEVVFSEDS